jgi:hypothetical protein
MTSETPQDDAVLTARALAALPPVSPSPALRQALIAAYDAWQDQRPAGIRGELAAGLRRFSQMIWPGAPVWAPGSVLAAALIAGIAIGAALPYPGGTERMAFSLDEPPAFSLGGSELVEESL